VEGSSHCLIWATIQRFAWKVWGETRKSIKIIDIWVEIWSWNLQKRRRNITHCTAKFGGSIISCMQLHDMNTIIKILSKVVSVLSVFFFCSVSDITNRCLDWTASCSYVIKKNSRHTVYALIYTPLCRYNDVVIVPCLNMVLKTILEHEEADFPAVGISELEYCLPIVTVSHGCLYVCA
jgi:hypothetical protein